MWQTQLTLPPPTLDGTMALHTLQPSLLLIFHLVFTIYDQICCNKKEHYGVLHHKSLFIPFPPIFSSTGHIMPPRNITATATQVNKGCLSLALSPIFKGTRVETALLFNGVSQKGIGKINRGGFTRMAACHGWGQR